MDDVSIDWTAPGAFEVAPGVHRLPLPLPQDGLRAVNVYVLEVGDRLTLIDAGWAGNGTATALEAGLRRLGRTVGEVSDVLVTHSHGDHYTYAVDLRRDHDVSVALGAGERESLHLMRTSGTAVLEAQRSQLHSRGAASVVTALSRAGHRTRVPADQWEEPDTWLHGTVRLDLHEHALHAIPTPGHTAGHYVFADHERKLLFAGDHVLPHITPSIGFEPVRTRLPLQDYLRSLDVVRSMDDMQLLPAHGPTAGSVHDRVDQLLAHHAERLEECRQAMSSHASTAYDIAHRLPWTRRRRKFSELDPYNQMLATLETSAHLDVLVVNDAVDRKVVDDVVYYAPARSAAEVKP